MNEQNIIGIKTSNQQIQDIPYRKGEVTTSWNESIKQNQELPMSIFFSINILKQEMKLVVNQL